MDWDQNILPTLIVSSPALIRLLPVNKFSNKLAPKVHNSIDRNSLFYSFASF